MERNSNERLTSPIARAPTPPTTPPMTADLVEALIPVVMTAPFELPAMAEAEALDEDEADFFAAVFVPEADAAEDEEEAAAPY